MIARQNIRVSKDANTVGAMFGWAIRHDLCTRGDVAYWILSGRPVDVLAELIGSSPQVIRRHYAHLLAAPDHLRNPLDGFR